MFCKLSFPNELFGHLMPPEDSFEYDGMCFVVADGITRDPNCQMDLTDENALEALKYYPNPSGARFAAEKVCQTFVKSIRNHDTIRTAFVKANEAVKVLNTQHVPAVDYLVNDFWGCVAAGILINDKKLVWGVIGDSEISVFSHNGRLKFRSPNSVDVFEKAVRSQKIKFQWEKPEGRKLVRSQYRNNPQQIIDGECISYGAITGESNAEEFIYTGELPLEAGDLVLVYTDGFTPTIFHEDFFKTCYSRNISEFEQKIVPFNLSLAKEDPKKYGKERTLLGMIRSS